MIGIYEILNKNNNKRYIGSSINVDRRIYTHKNLLSNGKHYNKHLQSAWNKYGEDSFEFNIIFKCSDDMLYIKEKEYINMYKALNNDFGYNKAPEPYRGTVGVKWSKESKSKLSKTLKKMYKSGERKPLTFKHSDDAKKLISKATSGHVAYNRKSVWCHQTATEYPSIHHTAAALGISVSSVLDNIKGRIKFVKGYTFEYADCSKKEVKDKVFASGRVLCLETGKEFDNQTEAAKSVGGKSGDLGRAIRKQRKFKGYTFISLNTKAKETSK